MGRFGDFSIQTRIESKLIIIQDNTDLIKCLLYNNQKKRNEGVVCLVKMFQKWGGLSYLALGLPLLLKCEVSCDPPLLN